MNGHTIETGIVRKTKITGPCLLRRRRLTFCLGPGRSYDLFLPRWFR